MSLNLKHLVYFDETVRAGSFAGAARELGLSSQAVAKGVRSLEDELGAHLFEKSGRGISPTVFGEGFSRQLTDTLQRLDDLVFYARSCQASHDVAGVIRLGVATAPYRCRVFEPGDFRAYGTAHPRCRLEIRSFSNELCASSLKSGLLDAAVIQGSLEKDGFECRRFGSLELHAVMATTHRLASREGISLGDLDGELVAEPADGRCLFPLIERRCSAVGARPHFIDVVPTITAAQRFLDREGIILISRNSYLAQAIPSAAIVPLGRAEGFSVPLYLAYPHNQAERLAHPYSFIADLEQNMDATPG